MIASDMTGKVALVTGAAAGLGRATALSLQIRGPICPRRYRRAGPSRDGDHSRG